MLWNLFMPQEKLKEKEREVRKRKEREEQELERVRVKARRKDAVSAYQALLTEKIKDAEVISQRWHFLSEKMTHQTPTIYLGDE